MTPILFVTSGPDAGGAEVVLAEILSHLDRRQFGPLVACLHEGPVVDRFRALGVSVEVIPAGRFSDLARGGAAVGRLRELIRQARIGVVHCNGTGAHLYGGRAARAEQVPCVYHLHDAAEWSWSVQGLLQTCALVLPSAAVVAVSRYVAESLPWAWRARRAVRVIPNGIDLTAVPRRVAAVNPAVEFHSDERPVVVWCGRLQHWKGTHVFLEAASRVACDVPSATFVIVGGTLFGLEPDYAEELRTSAATLSLGGQVRFVGQQPDGLPWMAAADLVVHSSIRPEPFGLTVLEAMAAGKPVIAAASGGPAEIVIPDVTGVLVPPDDPIALAAAMRRLLRDPPARLRLGRAGRERAAASFSATAMVQAFTDLYLELVAARSDARRVSSAA